ncbi:MAG: TetR/AcrR family transcriptional regulator [Nitrospinaceae bacterium]
MSAQDTIKKIGLTIAREHGLINLSRIEVCKKAGIAPGSFQQIMGMTFTDFMKVLLEEVGPQPGYLASEKGRVPAELRRTAILSAAVLLCQEKKYTSITNLQIAEYAGVSKSLVRRYFPRREDLYSAVMEVALSDEILSIIATGIALQHPVALRAPSLLRKKALETLV